MDIIERLDDDEMFVDAIDDAIELIQSLRKRNSQLVDALNRYQRWHGRDDLCDDPGCYQCNMYRDGKAALEATNPTP